MSKQANIRNFSIIAHIDHGKSTLADRLLEKCNAVSAWREHVDAIDFERYWTDAFWWKWTIDHGGEVKWKPGSSG